MDCAVDGLCAVTCIRAAVMALPLAEGNRRRLRIFLFRSSLDSLVSDTKRTRGMDDFTINRSTKIDLLRDECSVNLGVVVRGDCDGVIPLFCSGGIYYLSVLAGLDLCPYC